VIPAVVLDARDLQEVRNNANELKSCGKKDSTTALRSHKHTSSTLLCYLKVHISIVVFVAHYIKKQCM